VNETIIGQTVFSLCKSRLIFKTNDFPYTIVNLAIPQR